MITGIFLSLIGFHNFDTAQNFQFIDMVIKNYQLENGLLQESLFVETSINKEIIEAIELGGTYRMGIAQAYWGIFFNLLGMFLIGYGMKDYLELIVGGEK